MSRRFEELDSLRGLAALTVVFNHHLNVLPSIFDKTAYQSDQWLLAAIKYSPLHILWAGHEAVVFFFVISGFVLALPYFKRDLAYTPFILKRVSRIYLPYIVAVVVAMLAATLFTRGGIATLSSWFNSTWASPITLKTVLNHFLLIGTFNNGELDPVLWSLVHEMRISLLFPVVLYVVTRLRWKIALGVAVGCSSISFLASLTAYRFAAYNPDFFATVHYVSMFIIGALLARHRDALAQRFGAMTRANRILMFIAAVLVYTYRWWCFPNVRLLHISMVDDWAVAAGVSVFILTALSSTKASTVLRARPLLFCGRVSYSLYLYHAIALLTAINILYGVIPLWQIWMVSLAATVAISALMYRLVEVPSIKLGRLAQTGPQQTASAMPLHEGLQPEQATA